MDKTLFAIMNGAKSVIAAQTVHANNLANINTPGFRADFATAQSDYLNNRDKVSPVYSIEQAKYTDFSSGSIMTTGRPLDVAIADRGFFTVLNPQGQEAYTRAGNFVVNETGQLVNENGLAVVGNGGPISIPPAEKIEIAKDGTISVQLLGQPPEAITVLDRLKLVNPVEIKDLAKGLDGLIYSNSGANFAADNNVQVTSGALESSNVKIYRELTDMMALLKRHEAQYKMMGVTRENMSRSAQLLQMKS